MARDGPKPVGHERLLVADSVSIEPFPLVLPEDVAVSRGLKTEDWGHFLHRRR